MGILNSLQERVAAIEYTRDTASELAYLAEEDDGADILIELMLGADNANYPNPIVELTDEIIGDEDESEEEGEEDEDTEEELGDDLNDLDSELDESTSHSASEYLDL